MDEQEIEALSEKLAQDGSVVLANEERKAILDVLGANARMQMVMDKMEFHASLNADLLQDIREGLEVSYIAKVRDRLGSPVGGDYDFQEAREARVTMFKEIKQAQTSQAILGSALKFGLAIAPMV